ncbi:hypothetical protein JI750_08790 [Flavobacterium sp. GN10]|uniref:Uncharacterized protein n=1 Tax=Flavobacterium tagetis TaxID=2801336 RepID=A0ABS1KBX5_9FLAO|nr:hypothetical protein [Flavobacterium tagetis]MBL0736976.1 hypothetical protein [Flavobacterium tagetis]
MSKKDFHILHYISKEEILRKLNELGSKNLTKTGHGFSSFGAIPIIKSSQKSTIGFSAKSKEKPAIGLIDIVLSANRNYNKVVEPNIKRIEESYPDLKNFTQLKELMANLTQNDFYNFWGHKDEKKYKTLKNILKSIDQLKKENPLITDDFVLINEWGTKTDLINYKTDPIGSLPNIAIATFQHLRMVFGIDTIKPDQRVKEVLDYEFGLENLSDINTIKAVEQIAEIANLKVITVDQIFVQYGSSYYNQSANKLTIKQIAHNLLELGVDINVISKATLLTKKQIERIK